MKYKTKTTINEKIIYPKIQEFGSERTIRVIITKKATDVLFDTKDNIRFLETKFGKRTSYKIEYVQHYQPNIIDSEPHTKIITDKVTEREYKNQLKKYINYPE